MARALIAAVGAPAVAVALAICAGNPTARAQTTPPPTTDLTQALVSDGGTPIRDVLGAPETDPKCEKPVGDPGACPTLTLGRYLALALSTNYCPPRVPAEMPTGWCDDFERKLTDDQRVARLERAKVLRTASTVALSPEEVARLKVLSAKLASASVYGSVIAQVWHDIQPSYEAEKIK